MASIQPSRSLRERIETITRTFITRFEEASTKGDASIINHDVTADCTRHLLPASVPQAFNLPTDFFFNVTNYQEAVAKDIKALKFKNSILSNLVIDTETRRAAFTSIAEVHVNTGETYTSEMAWTLYFNEDGSKIEKVVEFCDKDSVLRMAKAAA